MNAAEFWTAHDIYYDGMSVNRERAEAMCPVNANPTTFPFPTTGRPSFGALLTLFPTFAPTYQRKAG